jgi:phosphatidylserine/phosphatidylglycerophosphate/cardiolipin synthase-like enzyme
MQPDRFSLFLCLLLLGAGSASCAKPISVETCYTPDVRCSSAIIAEIGAARSEILVQAHALTAKPVMDSLIQAREAGVSVTVILDHSSPFTQNSAVYLSTQKGVPTFIDSRHAIAGNNVVVIDRNTVITGSMAFTAEDEEKNAENVVVIRSDVVAGEYLANWNAHKEHSEEFVKIAEPPKAEQPLPKAEKKKSAKGKKKKKSSKAAAASKTRE